MKSKYHFKFEDLQIYQKAMDFGELVNDQVEGFLAHEAYKLSSRFTRPADSNAFKIGEGSGSSDANFNRYLKMAWDSSHECVAASSQARLRGYLNFEMDEKNRRLITELGKMISSLRMHLKNKK